MSDQSESEDEAVGGHAGGGYVAVVSGHDNPLAAMQLKLKELTTAYDLVVKNSQQLSKLASELESVPGSKAAVKPAETLALLKLTSSAIVKVGAVMEYTQLIVCYSANFGVFVRRPQVSLSCRLVTLSGAGHEPCSMSIRCG